MKNWILKRKLEKKIQYKKIIFIAREYDYNFLVIDQMDILTIYGIQNILS